MRPNLFWTFIGGLAVAGIWAISAFANYHAGTQLAVNPDVALTLGAASVASDVLKAVLLFVTFGALANRRWGAALLSLMLFVMCAAWSFRSAVYFATDTLSEKAAQVAHDSDVALRKLQLVDLKLRRAEFLGEQAITVPSAARAKTARREIIAENQRTSSEFQALVAETSRDITTIQESAPAPTPDPIAAVFEIDERRVMLMTSLAFAILLEVASSMGFWLLASARPVRRDARDTQDGARDVARVVPRKRMVKPVPQAPITQAQTQSADTVGTDAVVVPADVAPTVSDAAPSEAATNVIAMNIEEHDIAKIVLTLHDVIEPGGLEDRVLMQTILTRLNAKLPHTRRITTRRDSWTRLAPALLRAAPDAYKQKVGGQVWLYGVRLRSSRESATVGGSPVAA